MSVAFKEWALVCEALGDGRQSLILRKGGIAEGRGGFAFQHDEFFLFPTWFHEQLPKTTLPAHTVLPEQKENEIEIRYAATIIWSRLLTNPEHVLGLREFHVLHESVVQDRFCYDGMQGLFVAFVRVFRLEPACVFPMEKKFGGCRSWVNIPDLGHCALVSVLSDEEHDRRTKGLHAILG